MTTELYQKGKFYTLPIIDIRNEGNNSFFIVSANDQEYAIRMFDVQKDSPSIQELKELPCMVKEVHGNNIVFVQNFAQMFSDRYIAGQKYPFIVNKEAYNPSTEFRYYDVRDINGIPFRLKCSKETFLVPNQKIKCVVNRPTQDRLTLTLENEKKDVAENFISPELLLENVHTPKAEMRYLTGCLKRYKDFSQAWKYCQEENPEWVIKAIISAGSVEKWPRLKRESQKKLLNVYHQLCLYLLEDSDYLLQFSESERENYQEWIAQRISKTETYLQCLDLMKRDLCSQEVDTILNKIRCSGYIYHPHKRMNLLIAMFTMQPELLEEKIEHILELVAECAKNWKVPSFYDAFSSFLRFYIMSNREKTNRIAVVENTEGKVLLSRMVRSICFLLLMTEGKDENSQLYRSLLFHYLSFVRFRSVSGTIEMKNNHTEVLVDRAFTTLILSEENKLDFTWGSEFGSVEQFAYQMANTKVKNTTMLTRTFEGQNVRFTVSSAGITISRSTNAVKEKNILPDNFLDWHNLHIFLDSPSKYSISRQNKDIKAWKGFWKKVEQGLFEEKVSTPKRKNKVSPDVGTIVKVRVLWKDQTHPYRFYCRIEEEVYEGEGWIDTYQKGGSIGMFHYDPQLDIDSFYNLEGKPLLFKVRVNSMGSPEAEHRTYTFDAMGFIDNLIQEQTSFGEESDCYIFHYDSKNKVFCGITSYGYGIFLPIQEQDTHFAIGDSVRVRLTDYSKPHAIQGEIIGVAEDIVNIKEAATGVLQDYAGDNFYEETIEELEEEAMGVAEDYFDADFMTEIINIVEHKAILETDNIKAYSLLSLAHILARMTDDKTMMHYLEQRQHFLCILEDYGTNGRVNDEELENLGLDNIDMVEKYPLLKQRLTEMRIVNCLGQPEKNKFLWELIQETEKDNILSKLARLMLGYNMAEGFGLQEYQKIITLKIKSLLNVNVELPKLYSFGEENQLTEFKSSIVYPPNNSMREDIKVQTCNIMKEICGMVNAYGGTLYLGVNDTGTARGLQEDLAYFENSKDKFDNYVRNHIRLSLGDHVNASIVIEKPDAGKHFVYAIKTRASKTPVMLKDDGQYYLREGASTHKMELDVLKEIMDERDFNTYQAQAIELDTIEVLNDDTDAVEEKTTESNALSSTKTHNFDHIATSILRTNVTENWLDGYGVDTMCYLRIKSLGDWCVMDDVPWEDGILTLAIHDEEADGFLVIAFEDGRVNKVPISQITNKTRHQIYKMYAHEKPIFISPARSDTALLTAYEDAKGRKFFRLDDLSVIQEGRMMDAGNTLTDVEFQKMYTCEIIDKKWHEELERMHNLKRTWLGYQALTIYGKKEQDVLNRIGLKLQ